LEKLGRGQASYRSWGHVASQRRRGEKINKEDHRLLTGGGNERDEKGGEKIRRETGGKVEKAWMKGRLKRLNCELFKRGEVEEEGTDVLGTKKEGLLALR